MSARTGGRTAACAGEPPRSGSATDATAAAPAVRRRLRLLRGKDTVQPHSLVGGLLAETRGIRGSGGHGVTRKAGMSRERNDAREESAMPAVCRQAARRMTALSAVPANGLRHTGASGSQCER
ncbi:hypothetical protein M2169_006295 [Streptomyces sp. MJP52]|nr:hypothetical protein [Streptomyces sp. MJP52]